MIDPTQPLPDPTQPLPVAESEKHEENRNPSWFKPGQSGNPNGRPKKGYSIAEVWREMFSNTPDKKKQLANKIFTSALDGDVQAQKIIVQYMDGMPAQAIDLTSKGESITTPTHYLPTEENE